MGHSIRWQATPFFFLNNTFYYYVVSCSQITRKIKLRSCYSFHNISNFLPTKYCLNSIILSYSTPNYKSGKYLFSVTDLRSQDLHNITWNQDKKKQCSINWFWNFIPSPDLTFNGKPPLFRFFIRQLHIQKKFSSQVRYGCAFTFFYDFYES